MRRITLISLPAPFLIEPAMNPPLGLCYVGTVMKEAGWEVKVIDYATLDYDYEEKDYLKELDQRTDVVGIYCVSAQYKWLKEVSSYVKSNCQVRFVLAGGPHPSSEPEKTLRETRVDYVINGEAEDALMGLLNDFKLKDIPGLCYISTHGEFIGKPRAFVKDLNKLPIPDFSLFDMDKYKRRMDGEKAFHIITLRGCPYKCHFCDSAATGGKVRYISVERVLMNIDNLMEIYGVKRFVIYDDAFTLRKKRLKRFCEEFKKRGIRWRCWSRAEGLTFDNLTMMKDSGLESVAIGIESGSNRILYAINKGNERYDNYKALRLCRIVGVPVRCSLMFANPGETKETLGETISLIESTQPDEWNLSVLMLTPGCEFWEHPDKHGISFDKKAFEKNNYRDLNRSENSGLGDINLTIDSMPKSEMRDTLKWFVSELERVCPRKKIRDTIQNLENV